MRLTCLVRGSGDVGSAVAHALFGAGHAVCLVDEPAPAHPRRGMAFVDAVYDGFSRLAGVIAKRTANADSCLVMFECHRAIPVQVCEHLDPLLEELRPDVLVDARMRKRLPAEPQVGRAPVTIALGPGVEAGVHATLVVETSWGESLGQVLEHGRTRPLAGEPRAIEGLTRERFVYSPCEGVLATELGIGAIVTAGQRVATVGGTSILAPLAGCVRGLPHPGALIRAGAKVLEIDPRGDPALVFGIAERPARIAQGVLAALAARAS